VRTTAEKPYLTKNPVTVLVAGFFDAHFYAHVHPRQVPSASSPLRGYLGLDTGEQVWYAEVMNDMGHKWIVEGDPLEGGEVLCRLCGCRAGGRYAVQICEAVSHATEKFLKKS